MLFKYFRSAGSQRLAQMLKRKPTKINVQTQLNRLYFEPDNYAMIFEHANGNVEKPMKISLKWCDS